MLRVIAGEGYRSLLTIRGWTLAGGWLLLCIAVYLFNGLSDLEGDQVNGSNRPLATGDLPPSVAKLAVAMTALIGLTFCSLISWTAGCLALAFLALGWAYSAGPCLKQTCLAASAAIGGGAGLTYAAGLSLRAGTPLSTLFLPVILGLWVAVASNSKDFSDVDGDRTAGRRTLPIRLGFRRASWVVAAGSLVGGLVAFVLAVLAMPAMEWTAATLAVGSAVLAVRLVATASSADRTERRAGYRAYMLSQYLANLVLTVSP